MQRAEVVLTLGGCGLERVAGPLRALTGGEVVVGGWTQVELVEATRPALVYVDLFGWDVVAPLCVGALRGVMPAVEVGPLAAVVEALDAHARAGVKVVYRGLRRPSVGAWGLLEDDAALGQALDRLEALVAGRRVLDVAGLWARMGLRLDDVRYGMGHGEPLEVGAGAEAEARWLYSVWRAVTRGPIKCLVLDLDDTLIHGEVADDQFHARNPAYLPEGEQPTAPLLEGWWRLKRGLHEALRVVARRGVVLALATRNDPAVVASRWRKRPAVADGDPGMYEALYAHLPPDLRAAAFDAHPWMLDALALGPEDMVCVQAGFGPKSQMCLEIAHHLGISPAALAFLDDSPFERAEVRQNAPDVLVLDAPDDAALRDVLLLGAPFTAWEVTEEARLRHASYKSRAHVSAATQGPDPLPNPHGAATDAATDATPPTHAPLVAFLHSLHLHVSVRPADAHDLPRVNELLRRSHQLNLTAHHGPLSADDLTDATSPDAAVYVASCRDHIADHGLVAVGVFRHQRLTHWACSCRVLPHRVAPTLLWAMLCYHPSAQVERVPGPRNGATLGLIEEARRGPAPWVHIDSPLPPAANPAS